MNTGGPTAPGLWLEIDIAQAGTEISVTARGSRGEQPPPHTLGHQHTPDIVRTFTARVKEAATRSASLEPLLPEAQALHAALFRDGLQEVLLRLRGATEGEPFLLRLMPHDRELHSIPWEALCRPGTSLDFLGTQQELCIARGVHSTKPWVPREVRGAVRLLVISPSDEEAPSRLQALLQPSIEAGEIEWLEPLTGPHATESQVLQRLRWEPVPHVLHFIGHGGLSDAGAPSLRLADKEGQESWLKVELLAKELEAAFRGNLRLVVLEACQGAQPGALDSAAALLAQAGADAVMAHLWPVKADVARRCSATFYRSLTRSAAHQGDVARSLHDARRTVLAEFQESAEAFSPVLYLRGRNAALFDFKSRKVRSPIALIRLEPSASVEPAAHSLLELIERPFSLLLGDHWSTTQQPFRQVLCDKLRGTPWATSDALPMSALAQRYALQFSEATLSEQFQLAFQDTLASLPLVEALARWLSPGLHITLLRLPVLEDALAEHRPDLSLYVIQPTRSADDALFIRQHVVGQGWKRLDRLPDSFDPARDVVLLRLYRGYLPDRVFDPPLLTEDDYLLSVRALESVLPPDLLDSIKGILESRPALLLGMSLLTWDHRMLLHRLFGHQSLPRKSMVLLEPGEPEGDVWRKGRGLPGQTRIQVVQTASAQLAEIVGAARSGARP